jgi:phage shock protein A
MASENGSSRLAPAAPGTAPCPPALVDADALDAQRIALDRYVERLQATLDRERAWLEQRVVRASAIRERVERLEAACQRRHAEARAHAEDGASRLAHAALRELSQLRRQCERGLAELSREHELCEGLRLLVTDHAARLEELQRRLERQGARHDAIASASDEPADGVRQAEPAAEPHA